MVVRSNHYKKLIGDLKAFRKIISRNPHGSNDTDLHCLKVKSYILLTHAAFEEYLEEVAREILLKSVESFLTTRSHNACINCLVAFEVVAQFDEVSGRKAIRKEVVSRLNDFVVIASKNHLKEIGNNHGIKRKDQNKIFIPVGLEPEEIDLPTANALDSYGEKRGRFAHLAKIQVTDTRSSIETEVKTIADGLLFYDKAFLAAISGLKK